MSRWAAVLAGGSGTRFWPLSTPLKPKQMLALTGDRPLLVQTIARLDGLVPPERILILTGKSLADETRRLLPRIPVENILAEPRAASTAPALAWATQLAAQRDDDATVLSLHADWYVGDDVQFRSSAETAMDVAERHDVLVTVGIVPTRPDPGYGYIQPGPPLDAHARAVDRFIEKPSSARAAALIAEGALWNSGMFAWTARRFLAETEAVAPEISPHLPHLASGDTEAFFEHVTPIAVDVSHFERSSRVACVPGAFPWDDVGTWSALRRVRPTDESGNVLAGDAHQRDTTSSVIWVEDGAVVADGVRDLVIVQANGVTLVTTTERAANLKELLELLPAAIRSLPQ